MKVSSTIYFRSKGDHSTKQKKGNTLFSDDEKLHFTHASK